MNPAPDPIDEPEAPAADEVPTPAEPLEASAPAVEDLPDSSPFDDMPPEMPVAAAPMVGGGIPAFPFKGGQTIEVPPGLTLGEAITALRDTDYLHASGGRSYFWCAASRSGSGAHPCPPGTAGSRTSSRA